MSFAEIRHRLKVGRPLVLDSDTGAAFRARGVSLDTPGAVGSLLRKSEAQVLAHYQAEVNSRVDVLSALTADTTPRALSEVGMQHRSALLTGRALDLAFEIVAEAPKPVAVAGILGSDMVSPMGAERLEAELNEHADRIATAGAELLIVRGQGSHFGLMSAVRAAARTGLPTWAVVEALGDGNTPAEGPYEEVWAELVESGVNVVLFEVTRVEHALSSIERALGLTTSGVPHLGVLLASSPHSLLGFPDEETHPGGWVKPAAELGACGARVIGGGAGTTEAHTEALAIALGQLHPSVPIPRPS